MFIGRKNEASHMIRELQQGNNIILGGKYGTGRTSLVRHLASTFLNEWQIVFVDFSLTPGEMSEKLMKELGLKARFKKTGKKWAINPCVTASLILNHQKESKPL